jgi:hypothetical protein
LREGLRSITFHFEIIPIFEFYFSKEREKIKLIEWNEKDRNVDLGPTTTMVLGFSIWLIGGLGDCPQDEWANFTSRFQKKVIEIS